MLAGFTPASSFSSPQAATRCLIISQQQFALYQGSFLLDPDTARYIGNVQHTLFIGYVDGHPCEVWRLESADSFPGLSWHGLRSLIGQVEDVVFRVLGLAQQLDAWYDTHQFCGRCGHRMQPHANDRAMHCEPCAQTQYPKLAPCIIVLITRDDEVLLARSPRFPAGFFSTLAGFIEPSESVEECLHREVMEEVGLEVTDIEYLGSQNWPFPNSLMLGFHARYQSGEIVPQPGEIEEAYWWPVDQLPQIPPRGTISRWLIDCHLARLRGQSEPPPPL
ncbi:NAD(+) diphosphatase [Halopseudomonas salegens]|uniref:NAD-capped RNA hydrolase NudC n=1 Tax=Halopseudomonas salegens TaxID=1434072 RepID=A0A1H2EW26_9GAMM|nr:NAD(+) diphosphatase [Halopseudomonas salegens]SDT99285.1 NAD+ diphosphatase [Halopseudomonas salegens]